MSIASAIQNAQQKVANAYTACNGKGATMPVTQTLTNLATCIGSIQTGGSPTLQTKSVSLTNKNGQTFSADNGYDGLSQITVTPNNQARTVTPTKQQQSLTVNSGYSGNGTITVNAVNSSIDSNITAGNIKKDVTILGVTGTYEGSGGGGVSIPNWSIVQSSEFEADDIEIQNYDFELESNTFFESYIYDVLDSVVLYLNYFNESGYSQTVNFCIMQDNDNTIMVGYPDYRIHVNTLAGVKPFSFVYTDNDMEYLLEIGETYSLNSAHDTLYIPVTLHLTWNGLDYPEIATAKLLYYFDI